MTTYQRGHEPAGAPVTWDPCPDGRGIIAYIDREGFRRTPLSPHQCDAICAAFHAAAEWRKLAESAFPFMDPLDQVDENADYAIKWRYRFALMKETFGD